MTQRGRSDSERGARIVETPSGKVQIDYPGSGVLLELDRVGAAVRLAICRQPFLLGPTIQLDNWQAKWLSDWLAKA